MLRTVRLRFENRPDYELAFESAEDVTDPWDLLAGRADHDGRISLGDREFCVIEEITEAVFVTPEPKKGPTWERGLQDEDVATALDEGYEPPS